VGALGQEIVSKVPSIATRREHLTQSVVGTFAPYPKIRVRGQMYQLETFVIVGERPYVIVEIS